MSDVDLKCPKCQGEMQQGYTLDLAHSVVFVGHWVQGPPKRSAWGRFVGNDFLKFSNLKSAIPIGTYRCQSCGYLEAYAREEFRPS